MQRFLQIRILPFLPALIDLEQAGFVHHREGRDHTITVIHLIHQMKPQGIRGLLLSTNAEKAFDRVA